MSHPNITNGGKAPKVVDTHVIAFYDPKNGAVRHIHTVTVFEGGRRVSEKEALEAAHSHASRAGVKTDKLAVKTSKDPRHGQTPHRIDPVKGEFVALPKPRREAS